MPCTFFPESSDVKELEKEIKFLTNGTFDSLLDFEEMGPEGILAKSGLPYGVTDDPDYPLTEQELDYMFESETIKLGTPADLMGGHSALFNKEKYHVVCVEFHFRNDSTRHLWGTPVTYETKLPLPDKVLPIAERITASIQEKAKEFGGHAVLVKKGYIETDDRYALWVLIPFNYVIATFKTQRKYLQWLRKLIK